MTKASENDVKADDHVCNLLPQLAEHCRQNPNWRWVNVTPNDILRWDAQLAAQQREVERLREAVQETLVGLKNAPELNARNFDEDDALVLNEEVNIACCKLEAALSPEVSEGEA